MGKPLSKTRLAHWVRWPQNRTAWCGITVPEKANAMPWPITCKKCCRAIRKARLRQIKLTAQNHTSAKLRTELKALTASNWPNHPRGTASALEPARGSSTLVTGHPKPWPKELMFTSKDVTEILKFLGPELSKDVLKTLWITEEEERRIRKALAAFPQHPYIRWTQPSSCTSHPIGTPVLLY
jgi:hypothetical protein